MTNQIAFCYRGKKTAGQMVVNMLQQLRDGTSEGIDGIPTKMLKVMGPEGTNAQAELCSNCYIHITGVWPEDFMLIDVSQS